MQINHFDTDHRVLIIAEIGNNHEGDFEVAQEMVHKAAEAGAGAVKFQTFQTEHYVSPKDMARRARMQRYELRPEQFARLGELAHSLGLLFICTPLDLPSARFLAGVVDTFKIASGDNTFYPLIEIAAQSGLPLIVSTGVSDLEQVQRTAGHVRAVWAQNDIEGQLALLHCVSSYPVPPEQANLGAVAALRDAFPHATIGYSDHTLGIEAAVLSVAAGARIIEKHFTLDKHYSDFRDHQLSADPGEMAALVRRVCAAEAMLGETAKIVQPCEQELAPQIRRSIAAARDLPAGHIITIEDLAWYRPKGPLAPGQEKALVGKRLARDVAAGEQLSTETVE